jgi:hypothetical protein
MWPTIGGGDIEYTKHECGDDTDDNTRAMEVCLWQETRGCHHHHHHHHHFKTGGGTTAANKIQNILKSDSIRYIC